MASAIYIINKLETRKDARMKYAGIGIAGIPNYHPTPTASHPKVVYLLKSVFI